MWNENIRPQSSRIIKHVSTVGATTATLGKLRVTGPDAPTNITYGMKALIAGRNVTTTADSVSFVMARALAYRGTGSLTLNGTPTFAQDATAGAASTAASMVIDPNGFGVGRASLEIRVTGQAGQTYQWILDWHVEEVRT